MKPLSQYPKHKRKKIGEIRLKNSMRFDWGLNPSLFAVTITTAKETINQLDCIMAAVRQINEAKFNSTYIRHQYTCECGIINSIIHTANNVNYNWCCRCGKLLNTSLK